MFSRFQLLQKFEDAGKQVPFAARQLKRKKMDVAVEKRADVFVRRRNVMLPQDAGDDAGIGHARNFDVVQIVRNLEALRQRQCKRVDTCAARMDKGTINIE